MRKQFIALLALAAVTGTGACSGGAAGTSATDLKGQTVEVVGPWTGDEQKNFEKVLAEFTSKTGAEVKYTPAGDELPTVLQTRISGGTPPNVALIAQPGLVAQFAKALVQIVGRPIRDDQHLGVLRDRCGPRFQNLVV